ncbi:hypothetical protein AL013_10415 [Mariprofundus ferrooxydans]|uniref:Uncharacterized protein n=2 Tax=Mariprofundus ferrooxydans TaxID=314344 RepID=Q0EWB6_9PROT|nr:hypothetical protein SPV1_02918 [Mariprofundus ferrooxydans PV-1]KON46997.1 hypothetical protein AL013_10415 [Mariprofundus ferrooxydans]
MNSSCEDTCRNLPAGEHSAFCPLSYYAERIYMYIADEEPLLAKLRLLQNPEPVDLGVSVIKVRINENLSSPIKREPVKQEAVAKQDKPAANVSSEAKKRGKKASKAMHIQKASKAEKFKGHKDSCMTGKVRHIINTSVDDARYAIRNCDDISVLTAALDRESTDGKRSTLIKMLKTRIRKLEVA